MVKQKRSSGQRWLPAWPNYKSMSPSGRKTEGWPISQHPGCISCPGVVYLGETGRRLGDRFREHRLDVIKWKVVLPVPAYFAGMDHQLEDMQVAVIRAGLPEQDKRRLEEMRFIHNFGTLAQDELNQHFSFTWLARAHTHLFLRAHFQIFRYNQLTSFPWWGQHCRNVGVLSAISNV